MNQREDDEELTAEADFGWVNDTTDVIGLTEEQLCAVVDRFGCTTEEMLADLHHRLPRVYTSFIKEAKYEISRSALAPGGKDIKPTTAVSRDLKRIEKSVEDLETALNTVDPATKDWLRLSHEKRGIRTEDGSPVDFELIRRGLDWYIDILIAAAHESEGLSVRGPSNTATMNLIRKLANLWERVHGTPPTTDKARGNKEEDPFLELCRAVHSIGRSELQDAGFHLGIASLTRAASDVLQQMKSDTAD